MKRLEWLEAMRGFAALWVVLHHATQTSAVFLGAKPVQVFANGLLGVDFFFVLSGFIIAFSSQGLSVRGGGLREYATSRVLRIYIPYLPIGVGMLILYAAFPGVTAGTRAAPGVLTSLTLLPSNSPPALSVAWTLVHEMIFYAIFGLFFVSRRTLVAVIALWTAAIVGVWLRGLDLPLAATYLLSPVNLCFLVGVAIAWLTRNGAPNRLAVLLAPVGLILVGSQAALPGPIASSSPWALHA